MAHPPLGLKCTILLLLLLTTAAFNDCYSELMFYTVLTNYYCVSCMTLINAKDVSINDNGYTSRIKAVELV